ncbi:MAG: hypothetical protein RI922_2063 [Bacteroidota bacterium]|jgi:iron complex outermembrane receptor protein
MKIQFFIVILFAPIFSFGQSCFSGKVIDETTLLPLEKAQIYFPELSILVETDSAGLFQICNNQLSNSLVEVSLPGYQTLIKSIKTEGNNQIIDLKLHATIKTIPEIVISATRLSKLEETPTIINTLTSDELRANGALSLSDGIAKMPGVSQLNTGVGISKPVIRGLFGNRIQTVMLGLRFDNQQWQDEHGLGLSDIGVDHIEIIKGAASLLYGSEAMGGVLNVIEEKPAAIGTISKDISMRFFTNTLGNSTDLGIKGANNKFNWRIRLGVDSHADYTDGNNNRVLNSRFGGYYFKSSIGFHRKHWENQNDYMFSLNNFGFLMEASTQNLTVDNRFSRGFDKPHHSVFLHVLSSQNTFYLKRSKLKWVFGTQFNDRQEQEGGSKISLNMLLNSYSSNLLWIKKLSENQEITIGTQSMFQTNRNIGSRTIVPDANLFESSVFGYFKHSGKSLSIESGLRYSIKNIQTFSTGSINTNQENPGTNILPFNNWFNSLNGSIGLSYFDSKHWNVKSNLSSGYRPGNLAELSSNGLHEGSVRYEIGNTDLKIEQNICIDFLINYESKCFSFTSSVYANRFYNYIYLSPTNQEFIGFQIYRYIQQNALLKGTESILEYHPNSIKWFTAKISQSIVIGKTDEGNFLPFIPAQKISSEVKIKLPSNNKWTSSFIRVGSDYVFAQNHPGQFETSTNDYALLNAGIGTSLKMNEKQLTISIAGNNLLNRAYYDHLSRFKYFGILNMGRSIVINCKLNF